jgi:hypothetical protein
MDLSLLLLSIDLLSLATAATAVDDDTINLVGAPVDRCRSTSVVLLLLSINVSAVDRPPLSCR